MLGTRKANTGPMHRYGLSISIRPHHMYHIFIFCIIAVPISQAQGPQSNLTDEIFPYTKECSFTYAGHHYAGDLNTTRSGRTCQDWGGHDPHYNYYAESSYFPEGSAALAGARCRNPDYNWHGGLWCYTTDMRKRWERCPEAPRCECKMTTTGFEYEGLATNTSSGHRCQPWSRQTPHEHPYTNQTYFPDYSMGRARNYCRNPSNSRPLGPWCYVWSTGSDIPEWEYCNIPMCDPNAIGLYTRPPPSTTCTTPLTTSTSTTTTTTTQPTTTTTTQPTTTTTTPRRATTRPTTTERPPTTATTTRRPLPPTTTRTTPTTTTTTRPAPPTSTKAQERTTTQKAGRPGSEFTPTPAIAEVQAQSFSSHLVSIMVPTMIGVAVIITLIVLGLVFRSKIKDMLVRLGLMESTDETVEGFDNPTYEKGPVGQGQTHNGARSSGVTFSGVKGSE